MCWSSRRLSLRTLHTNCFHDLGNAKAIGPILLGMGAPVHVLQTGDDVNAIVQIASVAVMDVMGREGKGVEKKTKKK